MKNSQKIWAPLFVALEYAGALFVALLLAVVIRGFLFEPFSIPSESMMPTLLVGDNIFVKRFAYGLRVPFTKYWLAEFDDPKRGDVIVFTYPVDESKDFIKRVVGLPGDHVAMRDGVLFVNNKAIEQTAFDYLGESKENPCWVEMEDTDKIPKTLLPFPYFKNEKDFQAKVEKFSDGPKHWIQRYVIPRNGDFELIVPPRNFFVMGDNRDQSQDSRFWKFVPRENLKGKAELIWVSFNSEGKSCPGELGPLKIRWDRFGRKIY